MTRILAILVASAALSGGRLPAQAAARVLWHSPNDTAGPSSVITVMFDRPVAPNLDSTVRAAGVLHIEPSVAGTAIWRDPVTIRFVPTSPLQPGTRYTVSVDSSLRAADGSRIEADTSFVFRVLGPRLLERSFRAYNVDTLAPDGRVQLLYSAPVDLPRLERGARMELSGCPAATRVVALRAQQHTLRADDPERFRYAGAAPDSFSARFRTVVELEPVTTLPTECDAKIVIPTTDDESSIGKEERYSLHTVAVPRALSLSCLAMCDGKRLRLDFASPMRRADIVRLVRLNGRTPALEGDAQLAKTWAFRVDLVPRTTYTVTIAAGARDAYDRPLTGTRELTAVTGDYAARVLHALGIITVPRSSAPTFPLRSINVRSVKIIAYRVPDSARVALMSMSVAAYAPSQILRGLAAETTLVELPDRLNVDTTTDVPLPRIAFGPDHPMVFVQSLVNERLPDAYTPRDYEERHLIGLPPADRGAPWPPPYTVIQVTDLAVTARLAAATDGVAFVTDLSDGSPRAGVTVTQYDPFGRVVGRGISKADGLAALVRVAADSTAAPRTPVTPYAAPRFTVLEAQSRGDHVAVSLGGRALGYRPGSSLTAESLGARLDDSPLAAGALFVDRNIFRPGEMVHVKGVVRRGMLGALSLPEPTDSVRIAIRSQGYIRADDTTGTIRDTVLRPSSFGTIVDSLRLRAGLPLGQYIVNLSVVIGSRWRTIRTSTFQIAEYRAPEFVLSMKPDTATYYSGDTVTTGLEGRYLFDAPMRNAVVRWTAESEFDYRWLAVIKGWWIGGRTYWVPEAPIPTVKLSGTDVLDANGQVRLRIPAPSVVLGAPSTLHVRAAVVDVTNQTVSTETLSGRIFSGRVFAAARVDTARWQVGREAVVDVRAVDVHGVDVGRALVRALVLRHRLIPRDEQGGRPAAWVLDTVLRTELRPNGGIARLRFTPDSSGDYAAILIVADARGGTTRTDVVKAVEAPISESSSTRNQPLGSRNEPLGYRVVLKPERADLEVGQEARVHFDSPFDVAEAWITVEREGIIEQRRVRVRRGDNVVNLAIEPKYVPNVWVSVVLAARGETTRPDSATRRLRAGYTELRVKANDHRLAVRAEVERASYAPRDTATIRVHVADAGGNGVRSEIALWAEDQGVLSMTQMRAPDLLAQLYAARGVGGQLWSTLPTMLTTNPLLVATFLEPAVVMLSEVVMTSTSSVMQMQAGGPDKALRLPVSGGDFVRSQFASTAFYIGNAETDAGGTAVIRARVPDNLTTFHVYAVAVSAADQYGTGETDLLVTKPLVARASLPRFVRPTDSLHAAIIVAARDGSTGNATTSMFVSGASLRGPASASVSLSATNAQRAKFVIQVPTRDSAADSVSVRFSAVNGGATDAADARLPVRPDFHERTHAVLGATRDSQTVSIRLPADIDPLHSRLRLRIGTSRLSAMLASYRWLRAYPFDCTEQLSSVGSAIIAVWQVTKDENRSALGGDPRAKLQEIADEISRRQLPNGSFRYWPDWPWTNAWLTAYAGSFLLDARDLGVSVSPRVIELAISYLTNESRAPVDSGGMNRFEQRDRRLELGRRVAAVEFLRRAGKPDTSAERRLIRVAAAMTWEDRLRVAEVVAPRRDLRASADSIVDAAWREVKVAGHRVDLPDSANGPREFPSRIAPAARLLSASIALRPAHPLLAALVETVLQQGNAESRFAWSTQDYAPLVIALAHFNDGASDTRVVSARAGSQRFVAHPRARDVDTTIVASLAGLLETSATGQQTLRVHVETSPDQRPVYFALEVVEVPREMPVTPDVQGIVVERSYERYEDGTPVTRVDEGDLVRVRLRVTVPADRAFVALEDPLPAGLEAIDTGLLTSKLGAFQPAVNGVSQGDSDSSMWPGLLYGRWDGERWSPWEHRELHDDRVSYFARVLWTGSYTASYVARATTAGSFVAPPAYAEEMYNPALQGRTGGLRFIVRERP